MPTRLLGLLAALAIAVPSLVVAPQYASAAMARKHHLTLHAHQQPRATTPVPRVTTALPRSTTSLPRGTTDIGQFTDMGQFTTMPKEPGNLAPLHQRELKHRNTGIIHR